MAWISNDLFLPSYLCWVMAWICVAHARGWPFEPYKLFPSVWHFTWYKMFFVCAAGFSWGIVCRQAEEDVKNKRRRTSVLNIVRQFQYYFPWLFCFGGLPIFVVPPVLNYVKTGQLFMGGGVGYAAFDMGIVTRPDVESPGNGSTNYQYPLLKGGGQDPTKELDAKLDVGAMWRGPHVTPGE